MNNILNDAKEIREYLDNTKLFKEFYELQNAVNNSHELHKLENKVKYLKKCVMTDEEKEAYYKAKKEYEENPLLLNYLEIKKEVELLKEEIKGLFDL